MSPYVNKLIQHSYNPFRSTLEKKKYINIHTTMYIIAFCLFSSILCAGLLWHQHLNKDSTLVNCNTSTFNFQLFVFLSNLSLSPSMSLLYISPAHALTHIHTQSIIRIPKPSKPSDVRLIQNMTNKREDQLHRLNCLTCFYR